MAMQVIDSAVVQRIMGAFQQLFPAAYNGIIRRLAVCKRQEALQLGNLG